MSIGLTTYGDDGKYRYGIVEGYDTNGASLEILIEGNIEGHNYVKEAKAGLFNSKDEALEYAYEHRAKVESGEYMHIATRFTEEELRNGLKDISDFEKILIMIDEESDITKIIEKIEELGLEYEYEESKKTSKIRINYKEDEKETHLTVTMSKEGEEYKLEHLTYFDTLEENDSTISFVSIQGWEEFKIASVSRGNERETLSFNTLKECVAYINAVIEN